MSKDRLEEFIKNNRTDFDSEIPSLNIFAEIEKKIDPKPKHNNRRIATSGIAATIILAVMCSWFLMSGNDQGNVRMNESPIPMIADLKDTELIEASEYYTQKINKNKGRLAALNHHDPDLYRDLKHMEAMYDTLKMEWARNPHKSDEKLIGAMIANYRTRSMLLENVVHRVESNSYSLISARPAVYKH